MKKTLLWIVALVVLLGTVGTALFFKFRPQTITLSDGTRLTLAGVSYGKHHSFPGKGLARLRNGALAFDTTNDTLCLWIRQQHKPNNWPNYEVLAYDRAETACVGAWSRNSRQIRPGQDIAGVLFDAFPRRGNKIYLRFTEWTSRGQQHTAKEQWVISNPARGPFPEWPAESLPITQSDGDLNMTLTRLNYGESFGSRNPAKNDPADRAVRAAFRIEQNGHTVTNWQPVRIETSDATGNRIVNHSWSNRHENDEQVMVYQWGLWPDEPAWKLRVEFSRTSGFTDDELWTVTGVPVEPGNANDRYRRDSTVPPFAETTLNGVNVKLFSVKQFAANQSRGMGAEGDLRIHVDQEPEGLRLTLVRVTDDQDRAIDQFNSSWGGGDYNYGLRKLGDTRTLNITLALHRSRFAEFIAKPERQ